MTGTAPGTGRDHGLVDIAVIGGGINGAGIARDAAGRGLKVLLCEKGDFAEGTSSRSGKLVHGGLRYLEYYEFRLVREALIEREVLLASAPHIIWPMRFVLPHSPEQRPAWLVRTGLFLYDHLGGRKRLPPSRGLDLAHAPEGAPLRAEFRRGFEYSDCWVDDARLVILNLVDAARNRAIILPRTRAICARRETDAWCLEMQGEDGSAQSVRARALVNAAGPWVQDVVQGVAGLNSSYNVRLVKGSHVVVPKFWSGSQAYLLQNEDRRVIFVNPYESDLALIGTTDISYDGRAEDVAIDESEIAYLLGVLRRYFRAPPDEREIVHAFSGVRPLYDDNAENPSAVTRDYVFEVHGGQGVPPLLSIFGGKITTYRRLAEHALQRLEPWFPKMSTAWTAGQPLPGGDIGGSFDAFIVELAREYPDLPRRLVHHYARLYGTRARELVGTARVSTDLGRHFGGNFYECEAAFLREKEWARGPEDFLDRRTKHGLHLTAPQRDAFARSI
ncbi:MULTISPECIES: glycerol-3-phosphate dehydrogenase [unclassified Bradyrhizobium]|uniref:glycerol-3-phosphate dehydrogenase n=1 Tax=unclassified Bradyrhizobium TaxID=2631580 RepID=UPI00247ADF8D|nr:MULTISPECIES: glycerol-3-phosphate dehydrogenase [unclassified Bradyrhizobium]WGR68667.1 glycerol-3-phosphate dehydrogenase [Bradyrhizobium sp. ISRA426]WGR80722.1 glycerol-3-phosphate dehydrogenase [Bradyrhizobium sp. ISRA430]WGR83907.1 glycerol-3-phosphate dehydrogenase [Bradyrhizobium sp. ISRA432]